MGWNSGYTIFEATVVGAYDLGVLDKPLLSVLMEPYRDSDIDSGGSCDLVSKDGLGVVEIVLKTWGIPIPVKPDLPPYSTGWTDEQERVNEEYHDALSDAFRSVSRGHFGWS